MCRNIHTSKQTTEERIRWVEENVTSEAISEQIKRICERVHEDSSTKNPFSSLKEHFGFTLRKDVSTIPNAGHGIYHFLLGKSEGKRESRRGKREEGRRKTEERREETEKSRREER